jgi:predicted dehydrogenase
MKQKIRFAVVGLGHISQVAVLPAFKNAQNAELVALVSGDQLKLSKLSKKYKIEKEACYSYEAYDECLASKKIDAVFIALPNSMHREFTERAAQAGVHVLCEKPMAVTEDECHMMIQSALENNVKLMIAYRLHFERANMQAVELAQSGKLGKLRLFNSSFTLQVNDPSNIRLQRDLGGGPLYDIGIYCINAARYIFQDEPIEVMAMNASCEEQRFDEIEEMYSVILRFPQARLACFSCSFGATNTSYYEIVGTEGVLHVDSAYEYSEEITYELTTGNRTRERVFAKRDQFGAELVYFADCILQNRDPEPSGDEGLADVRIINALHESAMTGRAIKLDPVERDQRPDLSQVINKAPIFPPKEVLANGPRSA